MRARRPGTGGRECARAGCVIGFMVAGTALGRVFDNIGVSAGGV